MNKLLLSALGLAALGFVSCDDESYDDWTKTAEKQTYSQENIIDLGLKVTPAFSTVNLGQIMEGDVFVIDFAYSLPANANVIHNLAIVKEENATTATTYYTAADNSFSVEGNKIVMTADQLQTMVTNTFGKAPTNREFYIVDKMDYSINNQMYSAVTITSKVEVTPSAPFIDEAYYFLGTSNGWKFENCTDEFKFSHNDANNVYDDPIFTLVVKAPTKEDEATGAVVRDDNWFKIAPAASLPAANYMGLLGCAENGDTSLSGALICEGNAMLMPATDGALFYEISLNMMEYTYTVKPIAFQEFIYTPGSHNGWDGSLGAIHSPNMDGNYSGYVALGGEWGWKVKDGDTWYGKGATEGTLDAAGGNNDEGSEVTVNFLTVDLAAKTFVKTPIASFGLAGEFNGWNAADASTHMAVSVTDKGVVSYTITVDMPAGKFKFVANDSWDLNLGGETVDALSQGGADINIPEAGNYTITLYPTYDGNSHCTIVKN